jgi:hypothetical protein
VEFKAFSANAARDASNDGDFTIQRQWWQTRIYSRFWVLCVRV